MARTLLDYCNSEPSKPQIKQEAKTQPTLSPEAQSVQTTKKRSNKPREFPPIAPDNLPASYFVSASYDGRQKKAVIKLYEPQSEQIYFWYDNTGHKPYCLTNLSPSELEKIDRLTHHEGYDHLELIQKFDPLLDQKVNITKVVASDPLAIGGRPQGTIRDIIPEDFPTVSDVPIAKEDIKVWEAKIKYYQSYIYDRQLLPGMIYEIKNGCLIPKVLDEAAETLGKIRELFNDCSDEEREYAEMWAKLLEYPAPKFRRAAIDIEVYSPLSSRMPDAREGACPIIAVSVYSSDDEKKVLLLKREGVREGNKHLPADITIEYCENEEELIKKTFDILWDYPFILTFNGDDFDLRYLVHRAMNLGIRRSEIPIEVGKRVCLLKYGVHIDLYKFFFNRSVQIYAYGNRYKDVSLDDVGNALLGEQKIHLEKTFGDLNYHELAIYCLRDSEITYKLTSFDNDSAMKLILSSCKNQQHAHGRRKPPRSKPLDTQLHAQRTSEKQLANPKRRRHLNKKRQNIHGSHNKRQKIQRRHSRRTNAGRPLQRCSHGLPKPIPINNQSLEPRLPIHRLQTQRMQTAN